MAALPEVVSQAWDHHEGPFVFTTVDHAGQPNAIYATCVRQFNAETLLVADNFFNKTRANILAGSPGSLLFITKEGKSYQVKGRITYHHDGALFENMKQWNPASLPGHAVAALHVEHVFAGGEQLI